MVSCKGGHVAAKPLGRPGKPRLPRLNELLTMAALGWRCEPESFGAVQASRLSASRVFRSEYYYGRACIIQTPLVPARYSANLCAVCLADVRPGRIRLCL